ncbi:MAG: hypothetical protein GX938_10070 [Spirochaetales bacterium]|nr:hypothetical protein [Spirochaetales bacterium]
MDTSINLFTYRALCSFSDLIEELAEYGLEKDEVCQALNLTAYHLFVMYWFGVGDDKQLDQMGRITGEEHPREVLKILGLEALPEDENLVPSVRIGWKYASWYVEKSGYAIEGLATFAKLTGSRFLFPCGNNLENFSSALGDLSMIYRFFKGEPLFCGTTRIDRLFDQYGLSSFYQSDYKKKSKEILTFLTLWSRIEEDERALEKILKLKSDDEYIVKVQQLIKIYSRHPEFLRSEARPFVEQLRHGPRSRLPW